MEIKNIITKHLNKYMNWKGVIGCFTVYYGLWIYEIWKHGFPGRLPKQEPSKGFVKDTGKDFKANTNEKVQSIKQEFAEFVAYDREPYEEDIAKLTTDATNAANKMSEATQKIVAVVDQHNISNAGEKAHDKLSDNVVKETKEVIVESIPKQVSGEVANVIGKVTQTTENVISNVKDAAVQVAYQAETIINEAIVAQSNQPGQPKDDKEKLLENINKARADIPIEVSSPEHVLYGAKEDAMNISGKMNHERDKIIKMEKQEALVGISKEIKEQSNQFTNQIVQEVKDAHELPGWTKDVKPATEKVIEESQKFRTEISNQTTTIADKIFDNFNQSMEQAKKVSEELSKTVPLITQRYVKEAEKLGTEVLDKIRKSQMQQSEVEVKKETVQEMKNIVESNEDMSAIVAGSTTNASVSETANNNRPSSSVVRSEKNIIGGEVVVEELSSSTTINTDGVVVVVDSTKQPTITSLSSPSTDHEQIDWHGSITSWVMSILKDEHSPHSELGNQPQLQNWPRCTGLDEWPKTNKD